MAGSLSTSMRVSPWKPAIVEVIDPLGLYHFPSLAGPLRYLLADPVDLLGPMELCQWKPHGWQLSEM